MDKRDSNSYEVVLQNPGRQLIIMIFYGEIFTDAITTLVII